MSSLQTTTEPVRLSVRNVGGISETEVEFAPGVTVLKGRNATNRTSLLQAIKAACGSTDVSIKGDAAEASVVMRIDGDTYERTLVRENGTIRATGDSYLDDTTVATLFAFLLESNEARRAVARSDDLREIIMRPVDTSAIQAEISQLEAKKRQIDQQLADLDDREGDLPDLERQRAELEAEIESTESELVSVEEAIDAEAADVESEREEQEEVETKLAELRDLRSELDDVRYDEDTERESIERLQEELAGLEDERDELPDPTETDVESIRRELDELRERRQRLERKINELNTVVQFNEEMFEGSKTQVRQALDDARDGDEGSVTNQLLEDETVTCWTCGSTVEQEKIEQTIDLLRELRTTTTERKDEVQAEIDDLEARKNDFEERTRRRAELSDRLDRIEDEIETSEDTLDSLQERRADLETEIESVTETIEELRDESRSELLDLHERANELEYELGRLQNERDSIESRIDDIESDLARREDLESDRETVQDELVELRTRIERIQEDAIEAFNDHMETVLDLLEYENIDRIWIERTMTEVSQGRGTTTQPTFDLHIVRNSETGSSYEDTIAHLSESEREVVGLVFALAGYLVHDVHEECPFILLDSLEAIDSDRIAQLINYLGDYAEYLVVALLPEDAAVVEDADACVTEI